jgi:membrane protein
MADEFNGRKLAGGFSFMIQQHIEMWLQWLKHVVTQPRKELNRWQAAVRFAYDMGVHGWKALNQDNATQMAAALAYRSLFALLPIVVVVAVVVKGVRGPENFQQMANYVVSAFGFDTLTMGHVNAADATDEGAKATVGGALKELIVKLSELNLQALGWLGFALLVYAAIAMMVTIENSFNAICRAPVGRSWVRRITTYWFVITMGPAAVALIIYVNAQFDQWIHSVEVGQRLIAIGAGVWTLCMTWMMMFFTYWLVPNTRLSVRPTLIGALASSILILIGRHFLGVYFSSAFQMNFLYGTLGAIPVVMFWLYLMWLVVLFGLEVAATIQFVQTHSLHELEQQEKRPQAGLVDPAAVVVVMELISERFIAGRATGAREISDETRIPETVVMQMLSRLTQAGVVHWVETEERAVTLARPPEQICAARLIEIGYSLVDEGARGRQSSLVQRLRLAQRRLAERATLATMVAPKPPEPINQAAQT